MRIASFELENIIEFNDKMQVLIIENPKKYYNFCDMLIRQSQGEDGSFILSKDYKELPFSKEVFIIPNLFDINNYDRKFISKLYSDLEVLAKENYYEELNDLNSRVISFLEKLSFDSVFSLEYDSTFNLNSLLKTSKVDFAKEKEVFLEKLIDYVSVIIKYLQPKVLIIFGLKTVLGDEEIDEFYKFISYNSIKLLSIETHQFEKRSDEKVLLIDKDLCELTF